MTPPPANAAPSSVAARIAAAGLLLLLVVCQALAATDPARRNEPLDGAAVSASPVFTILLPAPWSEGSRAILELSRDHWESIERAWDTAESTRGWIFPQGQDRKLLKFQCPEPLAEGNWEWRVRYPSGSGPSGAETNRSVAFRVDATPPAEIEDLRLRTRPDGTVQIQWDPVTTDAEGKPESVDHYVVYRYEAKGTFPQSSYAVIGRTRGTSFEDRAPGSRAPRGAQGTSGSASPGTHYYKVVAVDASGNEMGVRGGASPEDAAPRAGTSGP
jgi:hypothetical protein